MYMLLSSTDQQTVFVCQPVLRTVMLLTEAGVGVDDTNTTLMPHIFCECEESLTLHTDVLPNLVSSLL